MHSLYLFSVWLHILAAVVWVGGTIFISIALVPAIRRPEFRASGVALIRFTAHRFRWAAWLCFAIFVLTGIFNLLYRGMSFDLMGQASFWRGPFGSTLAIKLSIVAILIAISALHDFYVGPRAAAAWEQAPSAPETLGLRKLAVQCARVNLLLAILAIGLGVMLVRGAPW